MKYKLRTETNEAGNLVFSKKRQGKIFIYLLMDENGNTAPVTKDWLLEHEKEVENLRVNGNTLVPVGSSKKKTEDFGEKIGGAKKDLSFKRKIGLSELAGMSFKERDPYVKKDKIWPKVSIDELVEQGHNKPSAWYINLIRASLPAKPKYNSNDMNECLKVQETYIKFIEGVRDICSMLKDHENVVKCNQTIMDFMLSNGIIQKSSYGRLSLSYGCGYLYTKKFAQCLNMDIEDIILETCYRMNDFLTNSEKLYYASRIINLEGCTYSIDGDDCKFTKQFKNANTTYYSYLYGKKGHLYDIPDYVENFKSYYHGEKSAYALVFQDVGHHIVKGLYDSYEKAENVRKNVAQFAAKVDEKTNKNEEEQKDLKEQESKNNESNEKKSKKKRLNYSLASVNRKGKVVRNRDIEGQDFINTFGIRGGEFGNWVNEDERQENMNFAYESFYDLALVLGIPASAIGLNHRLSIAFGSRGSGVAVAHYESGREVINLTRMKGAGSLAHEYFHAIDDLYGKFLGKTQFATEIDRGTSKSVEKLVDTITRKKVVYSAAEMKQLKLQDAQKDIDKLMKDMEAFVPDDSLSNELRKEKYRLINELLEKAKIYGFKFREEDHKNVKYIFNPVMNDLFAFIDKNSRRYRMTYTNQSYLVNKFFMIGRDYDVMEEAKGEVERTEFTTFYKNALKLAESNSRMGHNYWESNVELAARAFACYIKDKLAEQGYSNDYLCGHADLADENGVPVFPEGEERIAINKAFDEFFADLKKEGFFHA